MSASQAAGSAVEPSKTTKKTESIALVSASQVHTISLFVHDRPGVLVRVAIVFARRGYNIEGLVVSPSARSGFSRMTITCSGDPATLGLIIKQLAKMVDVVRVVDYGAESLVIRAYGSSEKIDALILLLQPYKLNELIRSGKIIMTRGVETT
ncbi:MAG: acetolactate synthase small subunit [Deltaproteobacteria bacterium]|nr:acetolactate synthase small subunit [Deltaproteobacteria bacterium]